MQFIKDNELEILKVLFICFNTYQNRKNLWKRLGNGTKSSKSHHLLINMLLYMHHKLKDMKFKKKKLNGGWYVGRQLIQNLVKKLPMFFIFQFMYMNICPLLLR